MKIKTLSGALLSLALLASSVGNSVACTVLAIRDANGNVYQARSNEFVGQQPDALTYYPPGTRIESVTPDGKQGKTFNTKYAIFGATLKGMTPNAKQETIHEAVNDQGMSLTTNAFMGNTSPTITQPPEKVLSVMDFGTWALGSFQNVEEVKKALKNKEVDLWLPKIASMGDFIAPLHFALYDKKGGSIVIEFDNGIHIYDNPSYVMTNDPPLPWHLQNLNDYADLTNIDKNKQQFNGFEAKAGSGGIALRGLPSNQLSSGRFVKAAFYSNFARKAKTPEQAIFTLGHVMNNFDRPLDISVDEPVTGTFSTVFSMTAGVGSESTFFTVLNDLSQNHFYIRTINSLNFSKFDIKKMSGLKEITVVKFQTINDYKSLDATDLFLKKS